MDAASIRTAFENGECIQAHARALALFAQQPGDYDHGILLLQTAIFIERVDSVIAVLEDLAPRIPVQSLHLLSFQAHLCNGNYTSAWNHLHQVGLDKDSVAFHDCAFRIAFKEYDLAAAMHHLVSMESLCERPLSHFFKKFEVLKRQGKYTEITDQIQRLQRAVPPGEIQAHRQLSLWQAGVAHDVFDFDTSLDITQKCIAAFLAVALQQGKTPATAVAASARNPWSRKKQHQVIQDVERLMLMHGLPLFVVAGSLLALVREGDFFLSDKDMDFGVLDADFEPTVQRLLHSRYFDDISPPDYFVGYKQLRHRATGFVMDITNYKTIGHKIHSAWGHVSGNIVRETVFDPFTLREGYYPSLHCKILMPDNAENYLCSMYGDWKTPNPHFDSVVAACNLLQLTPFLLSLGFISIADSLFNNRYTKARAGARHLQDAGFQSPLLDQIHALF